MTFSRGSYILLPEAQHVVTFDATSIANSVLLHDFQLNFAKFYLVSCPCRTIYSATIVRHVIGN